MTMTAINSQRKYIFLILAVCLVLRLSFWAAVKPWDPAVENRIVTTHDAPDYHILAINLVEKGVFEAYNHRITCVRTPGYPLYVAAHYLFAGPRPWVVLLSQCLLDTLSCFLLMIIAGMFLPRSAALIAGLFYALYPIAILNAANLISDILFVFLILVFAYFALRGLKTASASLSWLYPALAGLSAGFAALVRPVAIFLPLAVVFLFIFEKVRPRKRALGQYVVVSAFFLLAVVPWMVKNYNQFGVFSFSTSGAYNLLILNAGPLMETPPLESVTDYYKYIFGIMDREMEKEGLNPEELNDFQKAEQWKKYALKVIGAQPFRFVKNYIFGVAHTLLNLSSSEFALALRRPVNEIDIKGTTNPLELFRNYLRKKGGFGITVMVLVGGYYVIIYSCLLVGLFWAIRQGWNPLYTISVIMPLYFVLVTGAAGLSRFGLPAYPFILVFSATGAAHLIDRWKRRSRNVSAPA